MLTRTEYIRRKWARRVAVWGGIVLILAGLVAWLGPQAVSRLKTWRGRKLVDFAQVQKNSGNKLEMKNLLLQAYGLAPADPVVLKAMAEDYAESSAETLRFLQQLASDKNATREDKLHLCRAALDSRLVSFAEREFQTLLDDPASKEDPVVAELCARYLTLRGEPGRALAWTGGSESEQSKDPAQSKGPAQKTSESRPDKPAETASAPAIPVQNAKLGIIRAKLLLDGLRPDAEAQKKTAKEVAALLQAAIADGSDPEQRESATLLARLYVTLPPIRDVVDAAQTDALLHKLDQWAGDVRWDARLVAADLRILLKPEDKDLIMAGLVKAATDLKNEGVKLELGRWLNSRGEAGRAQGLADTDPDSAHTREWFLIKLDAMAAQKKWGEIETILLDGKGVPIEESLGRLFLWRCARELGKPPAEVESLRDKAIETAKKGPPEVDFFIAGYLEKLGETAAAESVYARHTEDEALAGPSYLGLVRCVGSDPARTSELKNVLQKMVAKFPQVAEAQNDLAYLNLLEGAKLVESIHIAEQLEAHAPEMMAYRTTKALAELVSGNFKQAEELYRNVNIDWKKVQPGWVVVRASVAGANGKKDEARKLIEIIDKSALRSGEKKLLEKYVTN